MNQEDRDPNLQDKTLANPCPSCGGKLMSVSRKDGKDMPEGTQMIIYCTTCDFEEYWELFKKRFTGR